MTSCLRSDNPADSLWILNENIRQRQIGVARNARLLAKFAYLLHARETVSQHFLSISETFVSTFFVKKIYKNTVNLHKFDLFIWICINWNASEGCGWGTQLGYSPRANLCTLKYRKKSKRKIWTRNINTPAWEAKSGFSPLRQSVYNKPYQRLPNAKSGWINRDKSTFWKALVWTHLRLT